MIGDDARPRQSIISEPYRGEAISFHEHSGDTAHETIQFKHHTWWQMIHTIEIPCMQRTHSLIYNNPANCQAHKRMFDVGHIWNPLVTVMRTIGHLKLGRLLSSTIGSRSTWVFSDNLESMICRRPVHIDNSRFPESRITRHKFTFMRPTMRRTELLSRSHHHAQTQRN